MRYGIRTWHRIDNITCDDLHLASVAGMDDIASDGLIYDDPNSECEITGRGLMI